MIQKYFFLPNAYENVCSYFMYVFIQKKEVEMCVYECVSVQLTRQTSKGKNMNKTLLLFVK